MISLNDLMMDRLLQATGGEQITFEEAVRLAVAAYDRVDWSEIEERVSSTALGGSLAGTALPDMVAKVRRKVIRLMRS